MKTSQPHIVLMMLGWTLLLSACHSEPVKLHGYVEAQLTYLSTPSAGQLEKLAIRRGEQVKKDDFLFSLDPQPELAELNAAKAIINEANARLENLLKGKRPTEIEAIESKINEAKAKITFLTKDHERYRILVSKSAVERQRLDQTTQDLAVSRAQLKELQANLSTAKLPARTDEIRAAQANLASTQALFDKSKWLLSEKSVTSPSDAQVFDTYFRTGERVPANRPVLSLLVPENIIAVFFVSEPQLPKIQLEQKVTLLCDNCPTAYQGIVRYISPQSEYTPPVIYSNSARSKLVYRVEATITPQNGVLPHPGQPIDILLDRSKQ